MDSNLTQYPDFKDDRERTQTETYLVLLRNAAKRKAEELKRISAKGADFDLAMRSARKYMRIMDYLLDRWQRERNRRKFGSA